MKNSIYKNLVYLISNFKNKPNILAKYLIDNNALSKDFIDKIKIGEIPENKPIKPIVFKDINSIKAYYQDITDELSNISEDIEIEEKLNKKLDFLLSKERYEEAIQIRDYMNKMGIKRKLK